MDQIIKLKWECSIDTSGSVFATSTCFKILKKATLDYRKDYERIHRFTRHRDLGKIKHHSFTLKAFLKSSSLRYSIEMCTFTVLILYFQIYFQYCMQIYRKWNDVED